MSEDFSALTIPQLWSHCAPTSLSYCLFMLGVEAGQREIARAAGVPYRVFRDGLDEKEVQKAANHFRTTARFLLEADKRKGAPFAARLRRHLVQGHPAMLLVGDFGHWIAVLGAEESGGFIIADPDDADRAFSSWTERTLLENGWNDGEDEDEGDDDRPQYFAILLKRRDGRSSRWRLTKDWMRLVERGSEETLTELADDMVDVARRVGGIVAGRGGIELAAVLQEYEEMIPDQVEHWIEAEVSRKDLRDLYRDFRVTADSLRLRVPRNLDRCALVAQMSVLLTTWAWTEDL